jgi:hypothetical protein
MNFLNSPVFIIGHPKSGTSLLTTILDSHPQLMVLPEESDFYSVIDPTIKTLNFKSRISIYAKKFILSRKIFEGSHLRNFFRGKIAEDIGGNFDYSDFDTEEFKNFILNNISWNKIDSKSLMTAIIEAYTCVVYSESQISSFKYWIEKTPKHIYFLKKIKNEFPNSKFIFIFRDPRDNYLSYRKKHGNRITAMSFSDGWCRCFKIAEDIAASRILFVKYEDLLIHPDKQIDGITKFLEIEQCHTLFQPSKMGILWTGNSMFGGKKEGIDPSGLFRYKTLIASKDQKTIEVLCRSNMLKYKYSTELERELIFIIKVYIKNIIFNLGILFKAFNRTALYNALSRII